MEQEQLYPIGIQTFSKIRENNYMYIDKTMYVYQMTHGSSRYIFLNRPRRFGKSLFTSTLHSYFNGDKELFKGLAIERLEREWRKYPVLHFDMSLGKHLKKEALERYLNSLLQPFESEYDICPDVPDANIRLVNLIRTACEKTGRQVVVLIDEYDAPLLDVVHEEEHLDALRNIMRNFYSPLKACDPYLRFVFLTGITKFSQLSIFSELNNLTNISMDEEYAAVCGITEQEMHDTMRSGIQALAEKLQITEEEAFLKLKDNYDGYHFTMPSPDIYNPFSLLMALAKKKIGAYWFGSGTPTYLIEMLRKYHLSPVELGSVCEAKSEDFDSPTNHLTNIIPLLYQSGYITIKDYDSLLEVYTLCIPNREVRLGLMKSLIPYYLTTETCMTSSTVVTIARALYRNDMDAALTGLQQFLRTVPYADNTAYEGHYQQVLYIIFSLLGEYADIEIRTPHGRIDMVLRTSTHLYVIELKLDKDAETAMNQIDLKDYASRFALCKLPVVKVGINFDSKKHTISDWVIK